MNRRAQDPTSGPDATPTRTGTPAGRRRTATLAGALVGLPLLVVGCGTTHASGPSSTQSPTVSAASSAPGSATVSQERARQVALAAVGGGSVTAATLDQEHRPSVWEVHVTTTQGIKREVDVDAATAKVLDNQVETSDDDNESPDTADPDED